MTKSWFCAQNSHIQQPNLSIKHHSTNNMTLLVKDQRMGVGKEEMKRLEHFTQRRDCIGVEFGHCTIKTRRAY
jgi:hypothetical protein